MGGKRYCGQDCISLALALATILSDKLGDAELNFIAEVLQLAGQQIFAIVAGRALCEEKSKDSSNIIVGK